MSEKGRRVPNDRAPSNLERRLGRALSVKDDETDVLDTMITSVAKLLARAVAAKELRSKS